LRGKEERKNSYPKKAKNHEKARKEKNVWGEEGGKAKKGTLVG